MLMPPPGAGKQPDGNDKEQEPVGSLACLEHHDEQNDSDQHGYCGRQVFNVKLVEKILNAVHVYIFCFLIFPSLDFQWGANESLHFFDFTARGKVDRFFVVEVRSIRCPPSLRRQPPELNSYTPSLAEIIGLVSINLIVSLHPVESRLEFSFFHSSSAFVLVKNHFVRNLLQAIEYRCCSSAQSEARRRIWRT
jgi:hypothetical protein